MRDVLIHDYFGIDYDIVWDVITNKIPSLHQEIKKLFDKRIKINNNLIEQILPVSTLR